MRCSVNLCQVHSARFGATRTWTVACGAHRDRSGCGRRRHPSRHRSRQTTLADRITTIRITHPARRFSRRTRTFTTQTTRRLQWRTYQITRHTTSACRQPTRHAAAASSCYYPNALLARILQSTRLRLALMSSACRGATRRAPNAPAAAACGGMAEVW